MKHSPIRQSVLIVFLLIIVINSFSQINISKANGVKLSSYKTFAFQKGQIVSSKKISKSSELEINNIIQDAVVAEMKRRGYEQTIDSTAQLVISFLYDVSDKPEPGKAGPLGQTPVEDPTAIDRSDYVSKNGQEIRVLILDMEYKNSSVWTANCTLSPTQKDLDRMFESTVESAFKKFPIQGKGK